MISIDFICYLNILITEFMCLFLILSFFNKNNTTLAPISKLIKIRLSPS